VNLFFRVIWLFLTVRRKTPLNFRDVDRLPMRARWTDLDPLRHVNNGVYLSMMDLGRVDLMVRSGVWKKLTDAGFYPVVASQTITYRKSLQWRQRFVLETRMAGYHDKGLFVEQRFVVDGEIYAQAFVKARFLKRAGGTVSIEELNEVAGEDLTKIRLEPWVTRWADDVALPSTRAEAPSEWDEAPAA
jgi:YbgC/YbaW family acyl-CoA thioester hydrolase